MEKAQSTKLPYSLTDDEDNLETAAVKLYARNLNFSEIKEG